MNRHTFGYFQRLISAVLEVLGQFAQCHVGITGNNGRVILGDQDRLVGLHNDTSLFTLASKDFLVVCLETHVLGASEGDTVG